MSTPRTLTITVNIANGATVSDWFELPSWFTFIGAYFPAMDDGDITMEMTPDDESTAVPILKSDGSGDKVVCASTYDPGYIDISDHLRALPSYDDPNHMIKVRFVCAQQTPSVDILVYCKE